MPKLLASGPFVFTELFPHPGYERMLTHLGFQPWTDGKLLISWPEALAARSKRSSVVALRHLPAAALNDLDRKLLEDHERLGFVAAALDTGEAWRPLVFARRKVKRIPCGFVIYAENRRDVLDNRGSIANFLLKRGMPILTMDIHSRERPKGIVFRRRRVKYIRGEMLRDRVDYAYSGYVYFNLTADPGPLPSRASPGAPTATRESTHD